MANGQITTNYIDNTGADLGAYTNKDYEITFYQDLAPQVKQPQLWAVGNNGFGSIGVGTSANSTSSFVNLTYGTTWRTIGAGGAHIGAVKTDGTLWMWGYDGYGQIGNGTAAVGTFVSSPVTTIIAGTDWYQVACGTDATAAIKTNGVLYTWGRNLVGQLGNNVATTSVISPTSIGAGTIWSKIACGYKHMLGIKNDGTLWTWGLNTTGQLGNNTSTNASSPNTTTVGGTTWKQAAGSFAHSGAVKTDGTLWMWGSNTAGQLGDNTSTNRLTPVQITTSTTWKQVACGYFHTAAVKTDGTLWTWGRDDYGQLGNGSSRSSTSGFLSPVTVAGGGTNWKQVSCGPAYTYGLKNDGTVWSWGGGIGVLPGGNTSNYGQLGNNSTANTSSPNTTVFTTTNWKAIATNQRTAYILGEAQGW